ncbi:MAG: hypothetical protein HYZ16_01755 [Bacteroidetes bacterium]|nr:hypothetical protein [Bacteroidota bacterium]
MNRMLPLAALLVMFGSCDKEPAPKVEEPLITQYLDCPKDGCQELLVDNDPYQVNPDFYGYADPSIRKDPNGNALWLAYSFPHYKMSGNTPVPSVAIHLAKSNDQGNSWHFVKKLFEPLAISNPADTGQKGFLDHEVVNLLPLQHKGQSFWLAARLQYFIPEEGGFKARPNNSFFISIVEAADPTMLTDGEIGTIGGSMTHERWEVDQILIPTEQLGTSFFWNEPALYYDDNEGILYLAMVAFVYHAGLPQMEKNNTHVYSTRPEGEPGQWEWSYRGILANHEVAKELGAERVSQIDLALATDGTLLLVLSPDDWNVQEADFNHKGCQVLEVESLWMPTLARSLDGKLRVRTVVTASDANVLGSGASAYDPGSATGLLFTKREKTSNSLTASIWITKLKP